MTGRCSKPVALPAVASLLHVCVNRVSHHPALSALQVLLAIVFVFVCGSQRAVKTSGDGESVV